MSDDPRPTGPPYLLLDARTGWRPAGGHLPPDLTDRDGAIALGSARPAISPAEPFGTFGGHTLPRGLAVSGADGRLFLADPDQRVILTWQVGTVGDGGVAQLEPLWQRRSLHGPPPSVVDPSWPPVDPYVLAGPTDVELTPGGDLVIADPAAGRLLVLAYPTARLRHVVTLPGWAPSALAVDHAGRVYVADPGLGTVHRFGPSWRRDASFPHRSAALLAPEHVAAVRRGEPSGTCGSCERGAALRPVVVVLDGTTVVGLDDRGHRVAVTDVPELEPAALRRDAAGTLHYADPARPWADPLPIDGVELTRDGRHASSGRPIVAVSRRVALPRAATFVTTRLDGGRPGFAWDRVVLHADLPENTRLLVTTRTDDSPLEHELAAHPVGWSAPIEVGRGDAPEALVQSSPGRYLWLRVELFGDGRATPRLRAMAILGPRASSARHLPAAYHQDPESAAFLDRFLAYFDTVFAEIGATHREVAALLDPYAVPAGPALDWLGSWFDLDFLAEWPADLRRRMVAEAVAYSRERGTVRGLRRVVQWHTGLPDPLPPIIEHYRVAADVHIGGEPLEATPVAHGCTVVLPERVVPDDDARTRLERLIADHVPAHVRTRLLVVPAGITVGCQSTVGVDTLVASDFPGVLGTARLGRALTLAGGPRTALTSALSPGWRRR